jgi:hypothetical protein
MLTLSERKNLANELVHIYRGPRRCAGFEYGAKAVDYIVRALGLTNNRFKDCSRFIHIGSCPS